MSSRESDETRMSPVKRWRDAFREGWRNDCWRHKEMREALELIANTGVDAATARTVALAALGQKERSDG